MYDDDDDEETKMIKDEMLKWKKRVRNKEGGGALTYLIPDRLIRIQRQDWESRY